LLTVSGYETGSPWDDTPASDILVFLTAVQEAADGVPLGDELMEQAAELAGRIGFGPALLWPEKRIANTAERLASFGAIRGGEVTSLGRWAVARLQEKLAEPDGELTAAELIAYLADCDEEQRDEEAWAWLDAQLDPAEAARQLLTAGASMEPRLRWIATDVVELLQEEAQRSPDCRPRGGADTTAQGPRRADPRARAGRMTAISPAIMLQVMTTLWNPTGLSPSISTPGSSAGRSSVPGQRVPQSSLASAKRQVSAYARVLARHRHRFTNSPSSLLTLRSIQ
jgi:hypothetical protein